MRQVVALRLQALPPGELAQLEAAAAAPVSGGHLGRSTETHREARLPPDLNKPPANRGPPPAVPSPKKENPPRSAEPPGGGRHRAERARPPACCHLPRAAPQGTRLSGQQRKGPLCRAFGNHLSHFRFLSPRPQSPLPPPPVLSPPPPGWAPQDCSVAAQTHGRLQTHSRTGVRLSVGHVPARASPPGRGRRLKDRSRLRAGGCGGKVHTTWPRSHVGVGTAPADLSH